MSTPEDNHANQNYRGGNDIPDKVHPMDALTATEARVFVLFIASLSYCKSSNLSVKAPLPLRQNQAG